MATTEQLEAAIARAESDNNSAAANSLREDLAAARRAEVVASDAEATALIDSYEGFGTELYEGIASGLISASEGAYSTIVSTLDAEGGDQKIKNYAEGADKVREYLSIDPQGVAGTIGEVGGQYVLPSIASLVATGGASLPVQLAALAATDFVVASDDYTGISNFFDNAPEVLKTQSLDGLSGREASETRLLNKSKAAIEGLGLGIVAPKVIGLTGAVLGATATAIGGIPVLAPAARVIEAGAKKVGSGFAKIEEKRRNGEDLGLFKNIVADTISTFRYRGILPEEVADERLLISGRTEQQIVKAQSNATELEKNMDKVFKRGAKIMVDGSRMDRESFVTKISDVLSAPTIADAQRSLDLLPSSLKTPLQKMRTQLNEVRPLVLGTGFLKRNDFLQAESQEMLSDVIKRNTPEYIRRRYRIFEDVNYAPSQDVLDAGRQGFKNDRFHTAQQLKKLADNPTNELTFEKVGLDQMGNLTGSITTDMAELARDSFLKNNALKQKSVFSGLQPKRVAAERIAPGMFVERVNLPGYQKALLGEVKNPLESYVATISDLSEFLAVDKYQSKLASMASSNPVFSSFIKDTRGMAPQQLATLKEEGYVVLGKQLDDPTLDMGPSEALSEWGALNGFAVPVRVYKDLTRTVLGDMGVIGNGVRAAYSGFLRGKGAVQYGKTVLSPTTQIRNVTSAAMFALAQGNIGTGANLGESMRTVMNGYKKLPDDVQLAKFGRASELGLIGSQAELKEVQALLKKGFDPDTATINGVAVGRKFGSKFGDSSVGGALMGFGKTAQNFYAGGDDLWKLYNWTFEQSKITKAIKGLDDAGKISVLKGIDAADTGVGNTFNRMALASEVESLPSNPLLRQEALDRMVEEYAAKVVRNTVPNYSKVPDFVKSLRKAPVGNFIAFPYEIIRTGVNTVSIGLTELASRNPEIQKIGLRRLMGASAAFYGFEETIKKLSELTTGVTQETMEAYKIAAGADYEKYSTLVATGPANKDGSPSSYVNLSYTNPYGMLTEIVNAATSNLRRGQELGKTPAQITTDAAQEVLQQFMSPFFEESIFLGTIRDVLDPESSAPVVSQLAQYTGGRAGRTATGSKIYNTQDSPGDKLAKSFAHIVGGLTPGISPFEVRQGEFGAGPLLRGALDRAGLSETLGVSSKDRQGRERELQRELGRVFTGISTQPTRLKKQLYYKGQGMASELREANSIWSSVTQRENIQSDELLSAYKDANEAKYRVMNKYKRVFDNFEKLGMSKQDIFATLKLDNISGADNILNNTFVPVTISDAVLDRLARRGTLDQLPREELLKMQLALNGRPFGEQSLSVESVENQRETARIKKTQTTYMDYIAAAKRAELDGNLTAAASLRKDADTILQGLPSGGPMPEQTETPLSQPAESFVDTATNAVSGAVDTTTNAISEAVDTVSNFGEGLYDRARTLAPGLLGDPKNQSIVDRQGQ